jgi:hypothetical protein
VTRAGREVIACVIAIVVLVGGMASLVYVRSRLAAERGPTQLDRVEQRLERIEKRVDDVRWGCP